jgi:alpha-mannosidase
VHDERASTLERARRLLRHTIRPGIHPRRLTPEVAAYHVHGEPVPVERARAAAYEPFPIGGAWGGRWDTTWFRLRATVPAGWRGSEVAMRVSVGYAGQDGFAAEALVWGDRGPEQGLSRFHQEHVVLRCAEGGEPVEVLLEAAANPEGPFSADTWPDLRPDYEGPPLYRLARAELVTVDRVVEALFHDFQTVFDLATELSTDTAAGGRAIAALAAACRAVDPDDVHASAPGATAALAPALGAPAPPKGHRLVAVGHAHLDTAWLWPVRETIRKCARTFSSAVRLMDEYPEYRFACSQPQHWAWVKEHYPTLYARMTEKVRSGQLTPVGAMWVEADCNIPSGESLVRQLVHGKRFYLEEFGIDVEELWLPDVFGYPASLPQLMRSAGVRWFLTQKISWNETNVFPHNTFWWEGIDGSRVLAHFPPADTYNGIMTVEQVRHAERNFKDHGVSDVSLYLFGWGDGGGGPTREMLESAKRLGDLDGVPAVEMGRADGFFERAEHSAGPLASWVGELYLELHRGTYTTQARTKRANRLAELALRDAELWGAGAGHPVDLDGAWKKLLLQQFHDVIPGSSIGWVYDDALRDLEQARTSAEAFTDAALGQLTAEIDTTGCAMPVVLWNSLSHDRDEIVELDAPDAQLSVAVGPDGAVVPLQRTSDGRLLFPARVPPVGYAAYDLHNGVAPVDDGEGAARATGQSLDNGILRVTFGADGLITSIYDHEASREVIEAGAKGNVLQLLDDRPTRWDAWDIDRAAFDDVRELTGIESFEVLEDGPHRASVRIIRRFGASLLVQRISLTRGSRRLDFVTEVDWHEERKLLKVAFPVTIRSPRATYEIQFGHVERPTHSNTSWDAARFEVCGHKWADLGESGYGVALLNDCKYGYDIHGNVMRLSLLRAPNWPDPNADRGSHDFTYSLLPHPGDFGDAGVREAAYALNAPLRSVIGAAAPGRRPATASFVTVEGARAVIDTIKPADDGNGVVLRLYEAGGGRGTVRMDCSGLLDGATVTQAIRTDLLERPLAPLQHDGRTVTVELHPFEIATIRVLRA